MKTVNNFRFFLYLVCAVVVAAYSCREDMSDEQFKTTDDLMIYEYIVKNNISDAFIELVNKADLKGMLQAYGSYSCFVPTDAAISEYLSRNGKLNVADLSDDECLDIVKFHVIPDTLRTLDFVDGRLRTANMMKMYLTTRLENIDGKSELQVNRQAIILDRDIRTGNGYIHVIDRVLTEPEHTIGELISSLGNEYSLFKNVMIKSGWADTLSRRSESFWYTVFLQSDQSFVRSGIRSEAHLLERLREDRPDIEDDKDLLWAFAAYHCVKGLYYFADLTNESALQACAPNQAITIKLNRDNLIVNEYINEATDSKEEGVLVDRESFYTDYSCNNGVLIDLEGYIGPKKRKAQAVFWDVCLQPEFTKDSRFRRASWNLNREQFENLSEITTSFVMNPGGGDFGYSYFGGYADNWAVVNFDALQVNMYRLNDIAFKLPLLTEGVYNVWICYRRADVQTLRINGVFLQDGKEEQKMNNIVTLYDYYDTSTDAQILLISKGMKRYVAKHRSSTTNSYLLGTIAVESTGRHTLRLDVVDRGRNTQVWIDMFHFIPIDDDQLWPRFDKQGTRIMPLTECKDIYPFDNMTCPEDQDSH